MIESAEDDRENPENGIENTLAERLGECRERAHEALEEKDSAGKTPAERKVDEIFNRMSEQGTTPEEERAALEREIEACDNEKAPALVKELAGVERNLDERSADETKADGETAALLKKREALAGELEDTVLTAELDKDVKCRMGWNTETVTDVKEAAEISGREGWGHPGGSGGIKENANSDRLRLQTWMTADAADGSGGRNEWAEANESFAGTKVEDTYERRMLPAGTQVVRLGRNPDSCYWSTMDEFNKWGVLDENLTVDKERAIRCLGLSPEKIKGDDLNTLSIGTVKEGCEVRAFVGEIAATNDRTTADGQYLVPGQPGGATQYYIPDRDGLDIFSVEIEDRADPDDP